jgi:hypothetical protein
MSKWENTIIGIFVGIACPLVTFVAFWWTTAALNMYVFGIPTSVIAMAALAGLGLGILLDVIFLRRWVRIFFTANLWLMAAFHLCLCVVAVGFFMGVPVGTFSLGVAAGFYIGRREHHRQADGTGVSVALRRVAVFVAFVTAAAALPIGILALQSEQYILRWLETTIGLEPNTFQGGGGLVLIGFLCLVLFVMQYGCAWMAGRLAFGMGADSTPSIATNKC